MPDRMPDRMPENMSDRMPEDLPVTKCINVMVGITRSKVIFIFCCLVKSSKHVKGPVTWQVGVSPAKYGFTKLCFGVLHSFRVASGTKTWLAM